MAGTTQPRDPAGQFASKRNAAPTGDLPATDAVRALADGTTVTVPGHLAASARGIDADGDLVVAADWTKPGEAEYIYPLTPCCNASGKGLMDDDSGEGYVGCRSCYQEVDPKFGGDTREVELRRFV